MNISINCVLSMNISSNVSYYLRPFFHFVAVYKCSSLGRLIEYVLFVDLAFIFQFVIYLLTPLHSQMLHFRELHTQEPIQMF